MDKQEIFDKVARHLLTQNEQSRDDVGDCMYRGCDGMMCAVGCLIPDALYSKDMEGKIAGADEVAWVLARAGVVYSDQDEAFDLLKDLQNLHDTALPETWPRNLAKVAKNHDLNDDVLGEFK